MSHISDAPEVKRLLNPGFISLVIAFAAEGFEDESSVGLPFLTALIIPPLLLHRQTREKLPKVVTSKLPEWTKNNPQPASQIPNHVQEFIPFTKRAIIFGANIGTISFDSQGTVLSKRKLTVAKTSTLAKTSVEIPEIVKKAYFVGRWLSHAGTTSTIYSILGMGLNNEA